MFQAIVRYHIMPWLYDFNNSDGYKFHGLIFYKFYRTETKWTIPNGNQSQKIA